MPKKKVVVDQNKCIGCNTCPLIAPETFALDPKTFKAYVTKQPETITPQVNNAISSCPVNAIYTTDEES